MELLRVRDTAELAPRLKGCLAWRQSLQLELFFDQSQVGRDLTRYFPLHPVRREGAGRAREELTKAEHLRLASQVLAAAINSTVVAGENLTVGSTVWLPAASVAP